MAALELAPPRSVAVKMLALQVLLLLNFVCAWTIDRQGGSASERWWPTKFLPPGLDLLVKRALRLTVLPRPYILLKDSTGERIQCVFQTG